MGLPPRGPLGQLGLSVAGILDAMTFPFLLLQVLRQGMPFPKVGVLYRWGGCCIHLSHFGSHSLQIPMEELPN